MLDAIVQFVRNALCCIKDLEYFPDSFMHRPEHTNVWIKTYLGGFELPEPLNKTTPLEVLISVTQLYACLSIAYSGLRLLFLSVGKMRRTVRLLDFRTPKNNSATTRGKTSTLSNFSQADRIVNQNLLKEAKAAMKGALIGFLVAPIGVCFFWLFANSWHVTETQWIGGWIALIDALSVMEACLFPLLIYMVLDGLDILDQYKKIKMLSASIQTGELESAKSLTVTSYEYMTGWTPFWEAGISPFASAPEAAVEEKEIANEVKSVQAMLDRWFPERAVEGGTDAVERRTTQSQAKDEDDKKDKIRRQALNKAYAHVQHKLPELYIKGYREFVYFVLNLIAFYGYLMGIITFYYPDDEFQPLYVQKLKFGYGNAIADWTGNFAGDLMWTIEPLFILGSPMVMSFSKPPHPDDEDDLKSEPKAKEE